MNRSPTVAKNNANNTNYILKEILIMKKSTIVKWVALSTALTAAAAFTAGVAYELHTIKKLTLNIDDEEEPVAEVLAEDAEA
jgi:hypothetical protein